MDVQEKMLKEYAESQGYKTVGVIKEFCGGTSFNRDGINKIYETVNKYKADAVIAKNISRFGRCSYSELSKFINSLERKGVHIITMNEGNLVDIPFFRVVF